MIHASSIRATFVCLVALSLSEPTVAEEISYDELARACRQMVESNHVNVLSAPDFEITDSNYFLVLPACLSGQPISKRDGPKALDLVIELQLNLELVRMELQDTPRAHKTYWESQLEKIERKVEKALSLAREDRIDDIREIGNEVDELYRSIGRDFASRNDLPFGLGGGLPVFDTTFVTEPPEAAVKIVSAFDYHVWDLRGRDGPSPWRPVTLDRVSLSGFYFVYMTWTNPDRKCEPFKINIDRAGEHVLKPERIVPRE